MNEKFKVKIISSLEKCFLDESISQKSELKSISMFQNEKLSFQIAYTCEDYGLFPFFFKVDIEGELSGHIRLRRVKNLSSTFPAVPVSAYEDYLRIKPGLYPDVIVPVTYNSRIMAAPGNLEALWVDISCEGVKAGVYPTKFRFYDENGEPLAEAEINITLFADMLPALDIYHTEWFYADCLAEYYGVPVFSDKHFEIIENYIKCAVENEINTVMTPVFTPPLDTYIGGERLTNQLVKINITDGKYCFDFLNLRRWIDICKRNGVKYYEMPHFYTQWGAKAAPKLVAEVNGREQIIFGWNTPALSDEYQSFLKVFITALTNELKNNGIFKQCIDVYKRQIFNSLFVSAVTTALYIILSTAAAFALSKSKLRFRKVFFLMVQFALLFNAFTLAIPQYLIYSYLGIIDTYWVYILPMLAGTMGVFLMKQYMEGSIPEALLEAARIDGAGPYRIFFQIAIPMVKPCIMTLMLFGFRDAWAIAPGETIFTESLKTLPGAVSQITAAGIARAGSSMAVTVILMIPPILVYMISQSNVLESMNSAGIKG